jgi:tetratricopeptide (TPR) repeat protein
MHFAPLARRVVVGLPALVTCFAVSPQASVAWQPFARSATDNRVNANSPPSHAQPSSARQPAGRTPLFHGQEFRWPTLPFMRSQSAAKPRADRSTAANRSQPATQRQTASRFGGPSTAPQPSGHRFRAAEQTSYNPAAMPPHGYQQGQAIAPHAREAIPGAGGDVPMRADGMRSTSPGPRATVALGAASRLQSAPQQIATDKPQATAGKIVPPDPDLATTAESSVLRSKASAAKPEADSPESRSAVPESSARRIMTDAHELSIAAQTVADYTRIIDACRQARASQPSAELNNYAAELASWAFNRRGQLKAEAGQSEDARRDFDDAIQADPERWRAIHNRGVLLAQMGDYERAFDDFSRTIQLQPEFAKAYSNRAALLVLAGDLETALQDYQQSLALDPSLAIAHRGRGRACHLLGRLDDAISHYNEAVQLTPEDAYAAACRADLLTDLGRYAEAAAEYERAIQLDPKSGHAYSSSAWLLATCPEAAVRDAELAIERAKTAIELTGNQDAVSFDTLAAAQANAGDFAAAQQTVSRAVQLAPPEEREVYEKRLLMYQKAKPYRIAPIEEVSQASYISDTSAAAEPK